MDAVGSCHQGVPGGAFAENLDPVRVHDRGGHADIRQHGRGGKIPSELCQHQHIGPHSQDKPEVAAIIVNDGEIAAAFQQSAGIAPVYPRGAGKIAVSIREIDPDDLPRHRSAPADDDQVFAGGVFDRLYARSVACQDGVYLGNGGKCGRIGQAAAVFQPHDAIRHRVGHETEVLPGFLNDDAVLRRPYQSGGIAVVYGRRRLIGCTRAKIPVPGADAGRLIGDSDGSADTNGVWHRKAGCLGMQGLTEDQTNKV